MSGCFNCDKENASYDCNGLKFCDWECFKEWDQEEEKSMDEFSSEYKKFYVDR